MRLINFLSGFKPFESCALGLGTFDGLHIGHRELIRVLQEKAKLLSVPAIIFTFDHSPKRILNPKEFLGEITTPEEKFSLLLATGVDYVVFRQFDAEFAKITPKEFIKNVIVRAFNAKIVVAGFNFGFGLERGGDSKCLQRELSEFNITTEIIPPVTFENQIVSSSVIRLHIHNGDFIQANKLLGREASFSGTVIHGDQRGRKLGFPTANLSLVGTTKVLPPYGVYLAFVDSLVGSFGAIVNIGVRPTFNKTVPLLEAHLLNFNGDLYGQTIRVRFLRKIRDEIRFPSVEALIAQLHKDREQAQYLLSKGSSTV